MYDNLLDPDRTVVPLDSETQRRLVKLVRLDKENIAKMGPYGWSKDERGFVPMWMLNKEKISTQCSFLPATGGVEYEFSAKAACSPPSAFSRQLSGRVPVDPRHLAQAQDCVDRFYRHYKARLQQNAEEFPFQPMMDYPDKFPSAKREKYFRQMVQQANGKRIPEQFYGELMVKTGEIYVGEPLRDPMDFDTTANRPRSIAAPARDCLGIPQAISDRLLKVAKATFPEFICGLNM